jgi:hypothetical protein
MKRTLLAVCVLVCGLKASAQCIPNPLYADSVFGVWPDTTENFAAGVLNVFYSDTMNLIVPNNTSDIDPDLPSQQIDSVRFDGIDNLPPGISVICNSQTPSPCTFLPAQLGCGLLEGTPTAAGTYELVLNVTAYVNFLGFPVEVPYSFEGYEIVVASATGVDDVAPLTLGQVQTVPNPFTNRTSIEFTLNKPSLARLKVFNLVGEELWRETVQAKGGVNRVPFEAARLPRMESGIYLYKVEAGDRTFTGRMVVNR